MVMLAGIALCSFGVVGTIAFAIIRQPVLAIVSLVCLLCGIVLVYLTYRKGQQAKTEHTVLSGKGQCPVCHINLAEGCRRCPRCKTEL